MSKRSSSCGLCDKSNMASVCPLCINDGLNDHKVSLKALTTARDSLYSRLSAQLVAKSKADDQLSWRVLQNNKLVRLREKLNFSEKQLSQGMAKLDKIYNDLKEKYGLLESAMLTLQRNRVEQLEKFCPNLICSQKLGHTAINSELLDKQSLVIKQICQLFPQRRVNCDSARKDGSSGKYDQICDACLPRGLDPHSVPVEELAASLGYMMQLLNLIVRNLAAPSLYYSGFGGSCSRIWQRDSYWNACPSSGSNEFPLFILRQNCCSTNGETSFSDRSSSDFGGVSMESEIKPSLNSSGPHSVETHKDLQKGISLLKKSVACTTAYYYNSLCLDIPPEGSTFEAFGKLLTTLSSSKELQSVFSLKMASSRSCNQVQQLNSANSSSRLLESAHTTSMMRNVCDNYISNSVASFFLYTNEISSIGETENLVEGWDIVEHPTFPPPPSQSEDIEHWTRAMFLDSTKIFDPKQKRRHLR